MSYISTFRRAIISLWLLTLPVVALCKVPNEDDIIDQTTDPTSENYYPNLQLRFSLGDSTLTADNYHYLYYGYTYQGDYSPLETNSAMDRVLLLAWAINPEEPNVGALDNLVISTNEALESNPFSPQLWNLLAFAYGALGDEAREKAAYKRVTRILETINESGDGARKGSPKHIIMFDHALDYLASLSIKHLPARIVDREVEYIPFVEESEFEGKTRKGLYFDYSRIYRQKPDGYEYKRPRSWQLNNLEPWPSRAQSVP